MSSLRTTPMISSRASRASCRSMAANSGGKPWFRVSIPRVKPSALRTNSLRWRRLVTVTGDSLAQPRSSSRKVLFSDSIPAPDLAEVASILSCWFFTIECRSTTTGQSLLFTAITTFLAPMSRSNAQSSGVSSTEPSITITKASAFSRCWRDSSTPSFSI
jgi:hypothetical protein